MIRGYTRLIFFAVGMVIGLQVPAFVDLYAQRVNAHYLEVVANFSGFQKTADRHFKGDVEAMILHHENSGDRVFIEGGENIRGIWQRLQRFDRENQLMQKSLHERVWHVLTAPDRELFAETKRTYNYTIPINVDAVVYGVIAGVVIAIVFDIFWLLLAGVFGVSRRA